MKELIKLLLRLESYRRQAVLGDKKAVEMIVDIQSLNLIICALKLKIGMEDVIEDEIKVRKDLEEEKLKEKHRLEQRRMR